MLIRAFTVQELHQLVVVMGTYFDAIDGDVDGIEADSSWSPVSAVGPVSVGTDEHVFTGSVEGGISQWAASQWYTC